jgi:DNA mismatch repair protein MutS
MESAAASLSPAGSDKDVVPFIVANDRGHVVRHGDGSTPLALSRETYLTLCPSSVIDAETLEMIQALRLHAAIDRTRTLVGSAVLLRSLVQPGTDIESIRSRQDALREIAADDALRGALEGFVMAYRRGEAALFRFFDKRLYALFPYGDFNRARTAGVDVVKALKNVPAPTSPYLKGLLSCLSDYAGSSVYQMMRGTICKGFRGLKSAAEMGSLAPKLKFIPRRFTLWALTGPLVAAAPQVLAATGTGLALSPVVTMVGLAWTGLHVFFSLCVKPIRDTDHFIEPFRVHVINDPAFSRAVDAVGMIDALLSCHAHAAVSPHATTLPVLTDDDRHHFEAVGLKNPVLAAETTAVVANHVHMNGARLSFISGPNSGGKTTVCKSIVHNQLLAQMGTYVMAETATINIADMISYQAPRFDGLQDEEGRFGTELARTRDIFFKTGPKSLVILDELAEGTTYEERLAASHGILGDFHTIGNNTVLVTHNHSLVDRFMAEGRGQSLMAEFSDAAPTYRIVPGISRVSHAERVAEKIRFSSADRRRYMMEKGYLQAPGDTAADDAATEDP